MVPLNGEIILLRFFSFSKKIVFNLAYCSSNRVTADRISFFSLIKTVCFEIWGKVTVLLNKKLNKGSITACFFSSFWSQ